MREVVLNFMQYLYMNDYIEWFQLFNFFAPTFLFFMCTYLCFKIHRPIVFGQSIAKKAVNGVYKMKTRKSRK